MELEQIEAKKAEEISHQYEPESRIRKLAGVFSLIFGVLALVFSAFHIYTAGFGTLQAYKQRGVHLAFVLPLIFLLYPSQRRKKMDRPSLFDLLLACLGAGIIIYALYVVDEVNLRGGVATTTDLIMGGMTILLLLEAARRSIGWELPIVAIGFMLYTLFGNHIPGMFGHRGFSFSSLSYHMYLTTDGIFGIPLGVSATYVVLFIIFGVFLGETGVGKFFNGISLALAGRSPGGPAKVAVFASGFMGTISGSAVANVVTTGTFTIPLMKKIGYRPHFAGAVEAVASTGGQIMPPVMGAAAFVMAEFLQTPYLRIMVAAIIPAILYYFSAYMQIHFRAKKQGLKGLPPESLPRTVQVIKEGGYSIIPIIVLVVLILKQFTPMYAAFWSIIASVIVGFYKRETRVNLPKLYRALRNGAQSAISVAVACAVVGFVIGSVGLTGLGSTLTENVIGLAGGSLLLVLIFTAIASIILGMGLPTTACYIIASIITAPIIIKMGIPDLAAHFFVFYFAVISMVTPPVALAAYAAAGLAGGRPSQVGWAAFKLAIAGFILPFVIIYAPDILIIGSKNLLNTFWVAFTTFIGILSLAACIEGYFFTEARWYERVFFLVGAVLLIKPGIITDVGGFALFGIAFLNQYRRKQSTQVIGQLNLTRQ